MPSPRLDLLAGTLEMLVLRSLSLSPMHGYAISQHIRRLTDGVLQADQGSLYPALERMLGNGLVTAKWGKTPTGRKARYYTLTADGRKRLKAKAAEYDKVVFAIAQIMEHS